MSELKRTMDLNARHSFHMKQSEKDINNTHLWQSDVNIQRCRDASDMSDVSSLPFRNDCGEYYKKYELDEVPVKDVTSYIKIFPRNHIIGDIEDKSLTDFDLDKLEVKVFENISEELHLDYGSSGLDANIKFFKTTVQEILDNFYNSMNDFELYKKKFHEILAKNKQESISEMEDFIKDMIQHIMSTESSISNDTCTNTEEVAISVRDDVEELEKMYDENEITENSIATSTPNLNCYSDQESEHYSHKCRPIVESYKNYDYMTDSTLEETNVKRSTNKEEIFNIYLLNGKSCVEIKMNNRNLLSEINLKNPSIENSRGEVASAENLKRLETKKLELEAYIQQQYEALMPDKEIPVKVSYAKKNIHLDEDFQNRERPIETTRSLMSKICSYFCRRMRKIC